MVGHNRLYLASTRQPSNVAPYPGAIIVARIQADLRKTLRNFIKTVGPSCPYIPTKHPDEPALPTRTTSVSDDGTEDDDDDDDDTNRDEATSAFVFGPSSVVQSDDLVQHSGKDISKWSTILVHMVCARLDAATLRNWGTHHSSTEVPTFAYLMDFLRKHCAILKSMAPTKSVQIEGKNSKFTFTSELPIHPVNVHNLDIPHWVNLVDPDFHEPDFRLRPNATADGFGWVVSGRIFGNTIDVSNTITYSCSTIELRELVTKFWELESCNSSSTLSVEETICEEHFEKTTVRDTEKRFVITLPKRENVVSWLGDSKAIALKQLHGMERRFAANGQPIALYVEFVQEYLAMYNMRQVDDEETAKPSYYLPHHAVLKPDSTTTKLRVVFDAPCRSTTGVSLNDGLMVGPVVQDDLLSIKIRSRFWKFVLVADIAKMYSMVKVAAIDQPLQRILWRNSPNDPVKTYELTIVTHGTASAPFLATRCLQQLATEGEVLQPTAAKVVRKDFYVDDLMTGTDTLEEGTTLAADLISLTKSAGFMLRKCNSNNSQLLSISPKLRDDHSILELESTSMVKTLGLVWEPANDSFKFAVPQWSTEPLITKRVVLADTARIFDPIGLIGPVTVQAKIFLQQLWKQKLDWNEALLDNLQIFWKEFNRNASALESLSVPRRIGFSNSLASVELHCFCDAAYGAYLYLRCGLRSPHHVEVTGCAIGRSLSRKKQSVPRLELS
ncbi:uncharacterized protein LOC134221656 [Armigeres subalbatus]|uniref:uncharacterized protein LOC134221656 n=1 Tax=Armigeres subalbatus TaxID=124917 RepID=UPI002ED1CB9E